LDRPQIFEGRLHAPYFIYFRRVAKLSDAQILAHFGLTTYRLTEKLQRSSTYAVIGDAGEWTLLADDWFYRLWHMPTTRPAIESLAKEGEVFAWSVGDCDQSFDYCLYRDGRLVRQYMVDSPHFSDQVIRTDFGERLSFESELLSSDLSIEEKMNQFTSQLGINPFVTQDMLRLYATPYESKLDLRAGIRNF
jgi:hypothetical protein